MLVDGIRLGIGMRVSTGEKYSRYYAEVEVVSIGIEDFRGRILPTSGSYYGSMAGETHSCSMMATWNLLPGPDTDAPD